MVLNAEIFRFDDARISRYVTASSRMGRLPLKLRFENH